eukprot:15404740-Alexandrium_andersonii.AAC.1
MRKGQHGLAQSREPAGETEGATKLGAARTRRLGHLGVARLRLGSRPNSRTARAAPIPGLAARSHSRAASKSRPGRLVDGVLAVDGARGA